MKNAIRIGSLTLLLCLLLCACAKKPAKQPGPAAEAQTEAPATEETEPAAEDWILEDELLSDEASGALLLSFGGRPFYAGTGMQTLLDAGLWIRASQREQELAPGQSAKLRLELEDEAGEEYVNWAYVTNLTDAPAAALDCTVTRIEIEKGPLLFGSGRQLTNALRRGEATEAELRAAFGEPALYSEDTYFHYLTYGTPVNYVSFMLSSSEDFVREVTVCCTQSALGDACRTAAALAPDADWDMLYAIAGLQRLFDASGYVTEEGPTNGFVYDGGIKVDGTALRLGNGYSALPEAWRNLDEEWVSPNTGFSLQKGGLSVRVDNDTNSLEPAYSVPIVHLSADERTEPCCRFELLGLSLESDMDAVLAALGRPTEISGNYSRQTVKLVWRVEGYGISVTADPLANDVVALSAWIAS